MKKWTRWQDWAAVIVGLYAALSTLWTTQGGMSTVLMVVCGVLLIVSGVVNLAMPGRMAIEWAQVVIGLLLFFSPWIGVYAHLAGAAWTSWIGGAIAVVATALAIKPVHLSHNKMMPSH